MRELHDHEVTPASKQIKLHATNGLPMLGGANHEYTAELPDGQVIRFQFHSGPVKGDGVNGITEEVLLAVLIDRLRGFQSGPFSCRENAIALTKLEETLMWMHKRTQNRTRRGVEGKLEK